jgi:methyl-accepting chemotaxis protein
MGKLSIRAKIVVLPVVALIGFLSYFTYSYSVNNSAIEVMRGFSDWKLPILESFSEVNKGLAETQAIFSQSIGDMDEFLLEDAVKKSQEVRAVLSQIAQINPEAKVSIEEILENWDSFIEASKNSALEFIEGEASMQDLSRLAEKRQQLLKQLETSIETFQGNSRKRFLSDLEESIAGAESANTIGFILIAVLAIVMIAATVVVSLAIRKPVERLRDAIAKVAKGDFAVKVEAEGQDAIAVMCRDFNALLLGMNEAISESNSVLDAIASGDFSKRIDVDMKGDLDRLKRGVNSSASSVDTTMRALDSVMKALANGDFSARMDKRVVGETRHTVDRAMMIMQQALQSISEVMQAAARGNFSRRMDIELSGDLDRVKRAINSAMEDVDAAITEILDVTAAMSDNDMTKRVEGDYSGSIDEMKQMLNQSQATLSETLESVRETAATVATSAKEIAAGNNDLSVRTERQSAAVEESAASMEEMSATVKASADNAKRGEEITLEAARQARESKPVVESSIQSMSEITEASNKISEIIGVMDSIAFQTNLLALNAAVEAARAGEQGRGFAVVASEVRSLAQRSSDSAAEIRDLINNTVEKVEQGNTYVQQAGQALDAIAAQVEEIAILTKEQTSAAAEQSAGVDQVTGAMRDLESANQQNSALVEEMAASTESLNSQAARLREMVERFNV